MNPSPLSGKKALITGASSGIGRAIALSLAEHGVSNALLARRKERLEEVAEQASKTGSRASIFVVDLSDPAETGTAVSRAVEELGGIDILINAAGVALQAGLSNGEFEDWKTMMDINVLGLANVTRHALPHFPKSGGHILNLSSMSGHRVPGKGGFYAATKFAVRAMTEGLRQELRAAESLTRVSSISPGFVDTELLDIYFANADDGTSKYDRIGYPLLKPEEIAELVVHQLTLPATAEVTDILVRPTAQAT
ncbi:MAG: SDR family NAD(P)-dependent oxidoreductase [Verrucomicrobiales bacterium]|nr:SDR family NAD(P)-dependent oxidoreductase [Verrucomicrobiales bacterium]